MEDILASIRRILSEDETQTAAPPPAPVQDDVLPLDTSMLVEEMPMPMHAPPPEPAPEPLPPPAPPPMLMAPEAVAAAASSVGSLLRTLAAERQPVPVRGGGPTIEDLVREEIRPLLKAWLDANLPALVERLARAEIERVVGRALS